MHPPSLQTSATAPCLTTCTSSIHITRKSGHPNRSKLKFEFAGCMQCFRVRDSCLVVLQVKCSLFSSSLQCCAALPPHTACHSSIHIMRKDCIRSTHFLGNFSHWAEMGFFPLLSALFLSSLQIAAAYPCLNTCTPFIHRHHAQVSGHPNRSKLNLNSPDACEMF